MNFFEHQEKARKQTGRLLLLLLLALSGLVFLVAVVVAAISYVFGLYNGRFQAYETGQSLWQIAAIVFQWQYLGTVSLVVLVVVFIAAGFRYLQLNNGTAIAEQLGGRKINGAAQTADEKRLLNVVEEMAIASGTPVPSVYIIDEPGINAFAAGYQVSDAIVGVTQGALTQLNRSELQGVIAHEFSHILNGDMRLNLRLISLIYGIMVLSLIGQHLLQGGRYSRKDRGATLSIGLLLIALGYLGLFFGNLIKAAISRQREFLADASAVQFTRSREGIAGALKKIGTSHRVWSRHNANEISHMLFSQGVEFHFLSKMMATHPPLNTRIKRIDPSWTGSFDGSSMDSRVTAQASASASAFAGAGPLAAVENLGELSDTTIAQAETTLCQMEAKLGSLIEQIHDSDSACALVYVLLLDENTALKQEQWQDLCAHQPRAFISAMEAMAQQLAACSPDHLMILLDIALPVIKTLSKEQFYQFQQQQLRLIKMDHRIELREWALFYLVDYCYKPRKIEYRGRVKLSQRRPFVAMLLSALAQIKSPSSEASRESFEQAVKTHLAMGLRWYAHQELNIKVLTQALKELRGLNPLDKPRLLKACIDIAYADGLADATALQVIACVAQAIDCPMPKFRHGVDAQ